MTIYLGFELTELLFPFLPIFLDFILGLLLSLLKTPCFAYKSIEENSDTIFLGLFFKILFFL